MVANMKVTGKKISNMALECLLLKMEPHMLDHLKMIEWSKEKFLSKMHK